MISIQSAILNPVSRGNIIPELPVDITKIPSYLKLIVLNYYADITKIVSGQINRKPFQK